MIKQGYVYITDSGVVFNPEMKPEKSHYPFWVCLGMNDFGTPNMAFVEEEYLKSIKKWTNNHVLVENVKVEHISSTIVIDVENNFDSFRLCKSGVPCKAEVNETAKIIELI